MNVIFTAVFILSTIALLLNAPQDFLPALIDGGKNSLNTALTLFCIYAAWMGLSKLCEKSGVSRGAAKALRPVARKLFRTDNFTATEYLAMNLSCNLLGLGGAATPYAVKAIAELEKDGNRYAQKLLFVVNATSVQILPTTVIALRAGAGSAAAADIFLPTLLCTTLSTALAATLFVAGNRLWR